MRCIYTKKILKMSSLLDENIQLVSFEDNVANFESKSKIITVILFENQNPYLCNKLSDVYKMNYKKIYIKKYEKKE